MNLIKFLFTVRFIKNLLAAAAILVGIVVFISKIWMPMRTQQNEIVTIPNIDNKNLFEALKFLDEADLTYKIDTFRYDEKIKPYQIIYTYPKSGAEVKKGRTILIKANAKTWRSVILPNLVNNSKRLAFTKIKAADLFVGDTIYEKDLAKDVVKRILYKGKEIKAGQEIPRYSKIDVVLGKGFKSNVLAPNLEGLTLENAKYVIEQNFFELGKIKYLLKNKVDSTHLVVYYQDPAPEDFIDEGMPINLWVSDITKDSLKNQIKKLHTTYRKYLFDSTGKLMTPGQVRDANQKVIKEVKKSVQKEQEEQQTIIPEDGISIE